MEVIQVADTRPSTAPNYVMTYLRTIAIIVISLAGMTARAEDILRLTDDTTIVISADEAWEDIGRDVRHFRGNFKIRTPVWQLQAEQVIIHGNLDDPQRIVAESLADGPPVRFSYQRKDSESKSRTDGEGRHLEYDKELNLLTLTGDAVIKSGSKVMRSSLIKYDLENEQLNAGGAEGVHITVDPEDLNIKTR